MRRILLVNTASLSAIVYNFPIVSDLRAALPDARIEWLVDGAHAALPSLHPAVAQEICVTPTRWPSAFYARSCWRAIKSLRAQTYDAIVVTQGHVETSMLAALAKGRKLWLGWGHLRHAARWFVREQARTGADIVQRNRIMVGRALSYSPAPIPDYGLRVHGAQIEGTDWFERFAGQPYAVFLHSRRWPEHRWLKLAAWLASKGLAVALPWRDAQAHDLSVRLGQLIPHSVVPPKLPWDQWAALIARARCTISAERELMPLCVALEQPVITLDARRKLADVIVELRALSVIGDA